MLQFWGQYVLTDRKTHLHQILPFYHPINFNKLVNLGSGYRREIWVGLFLLNTNTKCCSNFLFIHTARPCTVCQLSLEKLNLPWVISSYTEIFSWSLWPIREKKIGKLHISFSFFWNSLWNLIWITTLRNCMLFLLDVIQKLCLFSLLATSVVMATIAISQMQLCICWAGK